METYPSYIQFKETYLRTLGDFPKLDKIIFKQMYGKYELTGIQLMFEDGSESHLIHQRGKDPRYYFEMDEKVEYRWVSMLIIWNEYFEGIRFYDEEKNPLVDKVWSSSPFGVWSELQEIPKGQHIIGLKANLIEEDFITELTFILSPRPSPEESIKSD